MRNYEEFHRKARNGSPQDFFDSLLETSDKVINDAIVEENHAGWNGLKLVAQSQERALFYVIRQGDKKSLSRSVSEFLIKEKNTLQVIAEKRETEEVLLMIIDKITLPALNSSIAWTNTDQENSLHTITKFQPVSVLEAIMDKMDQQAFLQALLQRNREGETPLQIITKIQSKETVSEIIKKISSNYLNEIIIDQNSNGDNLFSIVLHFQPEPKKLLSDIIGRASQWYIDLAIIQQNSEGENILITSLEKGDDEITVMIINALSSSGLLSVLESPCKNTSFSSTYLHIHESLKSNICQAILRKLDNNDLCEFFACIMNGSHKSLMRKEFAKEIGYRLGNRSIDEEMISEQMIDLCRENLSEFIDGLLAAYHTLSNPLATKKILPNTLFSLADENKDKEERKSQCDELLEDDEKSSSEIQGPRDTSEDESEEELKVDNTQTVIVHGEKREKQRNRVLSTILSGPKDRGVYFPRQERERQEELRRLSIIVDLENLLKFSAGSFDKKSKTNPVESKDFDTLYSLFARSHYFENQNSLFANNIREEFKKEFKKVQDSNINHEEIASMITKFVG